MKHAVRKFMTEKLFTKPHLRTSHRLLRWRPPLYSQWRPRGTLSLPHGSAQAVVENIQKIYKQNGTDDNVHVSCLVSIKMCYQYVTTTTTMYFPIHRHKFNERRLLSRQVSIINKYALIITRILPYSRGNSNIY